MFTVTSLAEDGAATGGATTALVTEKATGETFEAERQMVREPELVDANGQVTTDPTEGKPTGETVSTLTYKVDNRVLSESAFYREYTPVSHRDKKVLRQEPKVIAEV